MMATSTVTTENDKVEVASVRVSTAVLSNSSVPVETPGQRPIPTVSVVPGPQPGPHTGPLVGIALPQTILSPRLVAPIIPTVASVSIATPTMSSISTPVVTQGQGQGSASAGPTAMGLGIPTQPKSQANADGEVILDVECGPNKAKIYLSKLCQGSKGPCVLYNQAWLTPNEFQYVSGRETAKDWKRSIRHHGKSMKLLMAKGVMALNPPSCRCEACTGIDPFANNNLPLQESLTANTSASGLKTLSQQPASVNSPPKVKVNNPSKKKPDKRPMNGNMAETAGAAGGIKAVQADINANTLAPVTSSSGTANDCYEFRDSPVQPVCALPPMLHPIPRGIPSAGIPDSAKMGDSEKENSQFASATCTSTPPGGPTLITYPVMQKPSQIPSESQPAFPSPTPESKDSTSDVKSENLAMSNGDVPKPENCSPEVKASVFMSPGKIGLVDSRDSKENQSKVFAPITWPPVVFGNAPVQGQPARSQKTSSPKSSPPASSTTAACSASAVAASSSPSKPSPSSSVTTAAAVTSPSVAKPMPTVMGIPPPSGIPSAVPGVPPVTISAAAVPAGYHEYMAMMMARYSTAAQNARTDEANYMSMVRKYYADWYEMYSRYPYAALSAGAAYPSSAASGDSMKAAIPGMIPFPGYMYPMATTDPRLIDLNNRAAVAAAATATAKEAETKLNLSPPPGVKRSISETSPGHDVLDLSVKKPRVESPVASRPSTVIPSHPNPLTHPIPGLIPPVGIPGHPTVGIPVSSAGGLTIPIAGLPTPTVQSLAAAGYPANMLDPRALALATGNGTSATLSLAHAQQQALALSSVGYPMAAAYMPHGMTFPQLCSASTTDRDKLLKAQHVPFAGDIRM